MSEDPIVELLNSRVKFYLNGAGEVGYGGKTSFLSDILSIYHSKDEKERFHRELHHNASDFYRGMEGSIRIKKEHFIKAIRHSLDESPDDGLNEIVEGSEVCEEEATSSSQNDQCELRDCFKNNFLQKNVAEELADSIIDNAWQKSEFSAGAARQDYISALAKDFDRNGSWKEFIEKTMMQCHKEHNLEMSPFFRDHNDSVDFLNCVVHEINEEKDDVSESYWESCRNSFYESWNINNENHLKELSEEKQVPFELLSHCAQFNYDVLEKYRPIKENQTFLESFGAKIWEPSEEPSED